MTVSQQLAEWLAALDWPRVPPATRELTVLRLLDTTGLLLGAAGTPAAVMIRERAAASFSPGGGAGGGQSGIVGASVVGRAQPVSASAAALAHGVIAHCLDYDDTLPDSVVHPGSAVVPVALAVGEEVGASGRDILTAIAGGYEIAARLAQIGGTAFHARGFHASGIFAPVAAAYTAGRLLRLPPAAMASAAGLAASMSGGLLAFIEDGSWSKWLHLGWGGHGGILAAQLAADGFRGPQGALDGRHNLFAAFLFGTATEPAAAVKDLGTHWAGDTARFKYYPCAHVIQPYIDLALDLRRAHAIDPAEVTAVRCTVAPWAVPIVCEPAAAKIQPHSVVEAIASLRFNVAAALALGRAGLELLEEPTWQRQDIVELSRRTGYTVDPALTGFAARLDIELTGGRHHAGRVDGAAPPDAGRLRLKFRALAARALPNAQMSGLEQAIATFADASDAAPVGTALRAAAGQA